MNNQWKMVPVEPTDDMIVAFAEAWYSKRQCIDDPDMLDAYRDMLAVSPVPPAGDVEVLAVVTLGGYFSSEELGDIDIEPRMASLEKLQQDVVRSDSDEHVELVDRAHITRLTVERDEALEGLKNLRHWRDLALQFDNHRMAALWHLKALLQSQEHAGAAHAFLEAPPMAAHEVVAERDDALAENSEAKGHIEFIDLQNNRLQSELTKARELLGRWFDEPRSIMERKQLLANETEAFLALQSAPAAKGGE